MGLKCQKCGADNLYTAVFCVQCGEKINLEGVTFETLSKKPFVLKEFLTKVGNWIAGGIFGLIFLAIILAVIPSGGKVPAGDPSKEAKQNFKYARGKGTAPGNSVVFSSFEITSLLSNSIKGKFKESGDVVPKALSIRFLDDNKIKVVVTYKYFGFVPVDSTVVYKAEVGVPPQEQKAEAKEGEKDAAPAAPAVPELLLKPSSGSFGRLPLWFGLKKFPVQQQEQLLSIDSVKAMRKCTKGVKTDGSATGKVTVKDESDKSVTTDVPELGSITLTL